MANKCTTLVVKITKPAWIIKSVIISSDSLFKSNDNVYTQVLLTSSNTVTVPIYADNNLPHVLEFRLVVGQGLDSNSFHTIEIKQLQVRKFSQFVTTAGEERAKT